MPRRRRPVLSYVPPLVLAAVVGIASATGCEQGAIVTGTKAVPHAASAVAAPGEYTHLYIHGHQDDWQLFMGDRAAASLASGANLVFVYTTAGDANQSTAYWQTRERAAQVATDSLLGGTGAWTCGAVDLNGHPIRHCARGPVSAYYMRLPDGGTSGEGWNSRGSLALLRNGTVSRVTALDSSTSYTSWADFTATVRAIVDHESGGQAAPFVEVHAPDWDRTLNPKDHADHFATADAVRAAASTRSWNVNWYIDYQTKQLTINLSQLAHDTKQRAFYGYDYVMSRAGFGAARFDADTKAWLWRTYVRSTVSVPTPPPSAPTDLAAAASGATRIDLTWNDASTNESGFLVERAPDVAGGPGDFVQIAVLPANSQGYADVALAPGTRHWYRVRAYSADGTSTYSNSADETTLNLPLPVADLTGAAIASTRVSLAWQNQAVDGTAIDVERATGGDVPGAFTALATLAPAAIAYTDQTATPSTSFWYRIRVRRGTDASEYAVTGRVTTPPPLAAPTNLTAGAATASTITLTWTDDSEGEERFTVERAPDVAGAAGAFVEVASLPGNSTSYGSTGLTPSTRYWYRVRAHTDLESSAYSSLASASTLGEPPAGPSGLTASAVSASRIDLHWTDNSANESGFVVERAADAGGTAGSFTPIATLGTNVTAYANSGLTPSTQYWYRIRAFNGVGSSGYSAVAGAVTPPPPTDRTDVYVHAHQDDWQLFMGERARASLQAASRLVFIYTTAGDMNLSAAYWQTREHASRVSVDSLYGASAAWACAPVTVNSHPIHQCTRGKVSAYFMRLPDGGTSGEGWNGRGSLGFFRNGWVAQLAALDGSTTYSSWTDLTTTVRAIIAREAALQGGSAVEVHSPDHDRAINVKDHPDHFATADAVLSAAAAQPWTVTWYVDYHTKTLPVNLTQAVRDQKLRVFYGYDYVMSRAGYGALRFDADYNAWLWRSYSR